MRRTSVVSARSAIAAVLILVVGIAAVVVWRASRTLHSIAQDVRAEHADSFRTPLAPIERESRFRDHQFAGDISASSPLSGSLVCGGDGWTAGI